jgi:hypothetical protein
MRARVQNRKAPVGWTALNPLIATMMDRRPVDPNRCFRLFVEPRASLRSAADLRGIVVELLIDDAVALPSLQRQFVQQPLFSIPRRHLEHPIDGDKIAVNEDRADAFGAHPLQPRQYSPFMPDQVLAADAGFVMILLHARRLGVKVADGFNVSSGLNVRNEFGNAYSGRHVVLLLEVSGSCPCRVTLLFLARTV